MKPFKIIIDGIVFLCQYAAFAKQSAITFIANAITPSVNIVDITFRCVHIVIILSKKLKDVDTVEYVANHV